MSPHDLDVRATLTYLSDLPLYKCQKVYEIWASEAPSEIPKTNSEFTDHENVEIFDVRTNSVITGLDTTGFVFLNHLSSALPTASDMLATETAPAVSAYLEEVIQLVRDFVSADNVICFDWRVSYT
jgi:hypothetical protein